MIRTLIVDHHPALRAGVKVGARGRTATWWWWATLARKRSSCRCYGAPGQTLSCLTATHRRSAACALVASSSA